MGLRPLCRADGPLCIPPSRCPRSEVLQGSPQAMCLQCCHRHLCKRSLRWVFCLLVTWDLYFLYRSRPVGWEWLSEREPAPLGIQSRCLGCMADVFPRLGKPRAGARWRARRQGAAPSPALPMLALPRDAVVGFSASWDLRPLRARAPGPRSSRRSRNPPTLCSAAGCCRPRPPQQLCAALPVICGVF